MSSMPQLGNNLSNGVGYGPLSVYANNNGIANSNGTNWGSRPSALRDIQGGHGLNRESHTKRNGLWGRKLRRGTIPAEKAPVSSLASKDGERTRVSGITEEAA